jgi:hypothetical protein
MTTKVAYTYLNCTKYRKTILQSKKEKKKERSKERIKEKERQRQMSMKKRK